MNNTKPRFFINSVHLIIIAISTLFLAHNSYAKKAKRAARKKTSFSKKLTNIFKKQESGPSKIRTAFGFTKTVEQKKEERQEKARENFKKQEANRNGKKCPLTESLNTFPHSPLSQQLTKGFQEGNTEARKQANDKLRKNFIVADLRTCTLNKITDEFIRAENKARINMQPLINQKINSECDKGITTVAQKIEAKKKALQEALEINAAELENTSPLHDTRLPKQALTAKEKSTKSTASIENLKQNAIEQNNGAFNKINSEITATINKTRNQLLNDLRVN